MEERRLKKSTVKLCKQPYKSTRVRQRSEYLKCVLRFIGNSMTLVVYTLLRSEVIYSRKKCVRNLSEVRLKIVCAEEKIGILVNSIDTKTLLCICYSSTGSARQRPPEATPPARVSQVWSLMQSFQWYSLR